MSIYPNPPDRRSDVRRAGRAISDGSAVKSDHDLVDQWRSAHGYVINTFQAWIKNHIAKQNFDIEFVQRLKRRNTVIDKLKRRDSAGRPLISDVTAMNDFAGCRMIFNDIGALNFFRNHMHSAAVAKNVQHELRYDPDKYNYIQHPRFTGYRGIHDVYKHLPRGSDRKEGKKPWDGLLVEIQYRTRAQNAWATAVEISDLLDGERTKFDMDPTKRGRFFAISSEIIARRHEKLEKAFPETTTSDLQAELQCLEDELGILRRLSVLKQFKDEEKLQKHNVLNIFKRDDGSIDLEVIPFKSAALAIEKATELENSAESINAVYVRADNPKQLRSAYRNYFNDPIDFVNIIQHETDIGSN